MAGTDLLGGIESEEVGIDVWAGKRVKTDDLGD